MYSFTSAMTLLGALAAFKVDAAPTASCTTFPNNFLIKEGSGYFNLTSNNIVQHDITVATANSFFVDSFSYGGEVGIPTLAYTAKTGITYIAYVDGSGPIEFYPSTDTISPAVPLTVELESNCDLSLTPYHSPQTDVLQDCAGTIIVAETQESDCVLVTASIAQAP